LLLIINSKFVT